jgi:hypothetical protein
MTSSINPPVGPRFWSALTDREQDQIREVYSDQTNDEICVEFNVQRSSLESAARRFPRDQRFKSGKTRTRAYLDRSKTKVESSLEDVKADEDPTATELERHRIEAELRDLRKVRRQKLDQEVWTATVIKALSEQIPRLAPTQKTPPPPPKGSLEEHALLLSDIQLGSRVEEEETGGLSAFGWDIFCERNARMESAIRSIRDTQRSSVPVKRLNIFGLGDYGDGHEIFKGHPWELDMHVAQQVTEGPWVIAQTIVRLLDLFSEIHFFTVYGNHGRVGQKREATPVLASWDYIFVRFLELMTGPQPDAEGKPRITFHYAQSWWSLVERMGLRFLMIHGDDVKSWMNLPYYGLERARTRWAHLIQQHLPPESGPVTFDVMLVGHHHTPAYIETASGPILLNGCWPGGSKFSEKVLQAASPPAQWYFGIHPTHGISGLWNLALSAPSEFREVSIVTD